MGRPKKVVPAVWINTIEAAKLLGVSKWWLLKNRERLPRQTWRTLNPMATRVSYRWNQQELLSHWEKQSGS